MAPEISRRVGSILDAVEREAARLRDDAQAEAARYSENARRRADDLVEERRRRIAELSDELVAKSEAVVARLDDAAPVRAGLREPRPRPRRRRRAPLQGVRGDGRRLRTAVVPRGREGTDAGTAAHLRRHRRHTSRRPSRDRRSRPSSHRRRSRRRRSSARRLPSTRSSRIPRGRRAIPPGSRRRARPLPRLRRLRHRTSGGSRLRPPAGGSSTTRGWSRSRWRAPAARAATSADT